MATLVVWSARALVPGRSETILPHHLYTPLHLLVRRPRQIRATASSSIAPTEEKLIWAPCKRRSPLRSKASCRPHQPTRTLPHDSRRMTCGENSRITALLPALRHPIRRPPLSPAWFSPRLPSSRPRATANIQLLPPWLPNADSASIGPSRGMLSNATTMPLTNGTTWLCTRWSNP